MSNSDSFKLGIHHHQQLEDFNQPSWFSTYLRTLRHQQGYSDQARELRQKLIANQQQYLNASSLRERDLVMAGKHTMGRNIMPRIIRRQFNAAMKSMKLTSGVKSSDDDINNRGLQQQGSRGADKLMPSMEYPRFPFELSQVGIIPAISPPPRHSSPPKLQHKQSFSPAYGNGNKNGPSGIMVEYEGNVAHHKNAEMDNENIAVYKDIDVIRIPYESEDTTHLPAINTNIRGAFLVEKDWTPVKRNTVVTPVEETSLQDDIEQEIINDVVDKVSQKAAKRKDKRVQFAEELVIFIPEIRYRKINKKKGIGRRTSKNSQKMTANETNAKHERSQEQMQDELTTATVAQEEDNTASGVNDQDQTENKNDIIDTEFEELGKKYVEKRRRRASYKSKHRRSIQLSSTPKLSFAISELGGQEVEDLAMATEHPSSLSPDGDIESRNSHLPPLNNLPKEGQQNQDELSRVDEKRRPNSPYFPPIVSRNKHYQTFSHWD